MSYRDYYEVGNDVWPLYKQPGKQLLKASRMGKLLLFLSFFLFVTYFLNLFALHH